VLFDLQSRGRRRTIKVVYVALAVLMFVGFVGFSVGSNVSGGIFDAITQGGGGGDQAGDRARAQVTRAEAATRANPRDADAWATLAVARVRLAGTGDNYQLDDATQTGTYTAAGRRQLTAAATAWDRYLALDPKTDTEGAARQARVMLNAFVALERPADAVAAQEIVTETNETSATMAQLAVYAWSAGQDRKGDLASQRAVALAPSAQRSTLKSQLDQQKAQAQAAAGTTAATPTATATAAR
jgi:hypothetical protein